MYSEVTPYITTINTFVQPTYQRFIRNISYLVRSKSIQIIVLRIYQNLRDS